MKTFWLKELTQAEKQSIIKSRSEKFGVPFTATPIAGGTAIRPCVDKTVIADTFGLDKILSVLERGNPKSFIQISDETGLTLRQVIAVAKTINTGGTGSLRETDEAVKNVTCDIDRSGKVVALHKVK